MAREGAGRERGGKEGKGRRGAKGSGEGEGSGRRMGIVHPLFSA